MSSIKKPSLLTAHKNKVKMDTGKKGNQKDVMDLLDTVKLISGESLILLNGKLKKNIFEYPTSGFHVSEPDENDTSISDRMDGVYNHLNNLIYVLNQHGV